MNHMALDGVLLFVGAVLLYLGAEWLVGGAAGLARAFGVAPLVVGLTVVAFGTSAPELVVSLVATLGGRGSLAVGNVVGSNIANLGLILGLTATLARLPVDGGLVRREVPILVITTGLLPLVLFDGRIDRVEAGFLLAFAAGLTLFLLKTPSAEEVAREIEIVDEVASRSTLGRQRLRLAGLTILGLLVLVAGGRILVDSAVRVALAFGMSERIVGLTIVAVGTSLPELAASVVATLRGHGAMAVGNILGSNVFNILFVLGGAALARPVAVHFQDFAGDLIILVPFTLWTAFMLRRERSTTRWEGLVLCSAYAAYLALLARPGG